MDKMIYLIGGGGHGIVVLNALLMSGRQVAGIVDPAFPVGERRLGVPVLGGDDVLTAVDPSSAILASGLGIFKGTQARAAVFQRFCERGFEFLAVVHPAATIGHEVGLGAGCQIMAGVVLQPGVVIGRGSVINTGAFVDHETVVGDHVFIGPGAVLCGNCRIEDGAFVGAGATILPSVTVGAGTTVGAGATVLRSVRPGVVVAGVPAVELAQKGKA